VVNVLLHLELNDKRPYAIGLSNCSCTVKRRNIQMNLHVARFNTAVLELPRSRHLVHLATIHTSISNESIWYECGTWPDTRQAQPANASHATAGCPRCLYMALTRSTGWNRLEMRAAILNFEMD